MERAHGVVWRVKPDISSPKRIFPDFRAGMWCHVLCVTCSLTYISASLVIFEKDSFCSCYPSEILVSTSGEKNVALFGSWSNFCAPSHPGLFCPMIPWLILLALFTGFLWAPLLYYPYSDLWDL